MCLFLCVIKQIVESVINAIKQENKVYNESMSSFWTQNRVIFTLTFFLFHRVFDNLLQNVSFFYYTIPL